MPVRQIDFTTREGTWMQPDLSPDGRTVLFDLLGDIYAIDAAGGTARPLLSGTAFETHPVFSPDGRRFAFVSDRSGTTNLWIANADGTGLRQLSQETSLNVMTSPAWSPDGRTVYVSRMVHAVLAFELWAFGVDGGAGARITKAQPNGDDDWDNRHNALGVAPAPDGRFLYYAVKHGHTWTEKDPPTWSIARRDLRDGSETVIVDGGMQPALSHDGRQLAYAAREGRATVLRLRDLEDGADRRIAAIDHDGQEQGYYAGLLPRYAFAPGDKALVLSVGGKLARLDPASGRFADIPFSAHVQLGLGPATRVQQHDETGPIRVRVIQAPRLSPDGRTVAFTALGGLYVQEVAGGAPRRIATHGQAFQPRWSPDGKRLVFVTWTARDGGAIWTVPLTGGKSVRLTDRPAFYTEPVFAPDGRSVVALRASHYDRMRAVNELSPDRPTDIVTLPAGGGSATLVAHVFGARLLDFGDDPARVRFYAPAGLSSIRLDGTDLRVTLSVTAQSPSQYVAESVPVEEARLSPDGRHALARTGSQLTLIDVPPANGKDAPAVDLAAPGPARIRLTRVGADFFDWADEGRTILWSVGATIRRLPLAAVDRASPGASEARAVSVEAPVLVPRDVPSGAIVLRGATALTMKGDAVIERADVVIVGNRVAAIGPAGRVTVPAGATIRDVTGRFILPGFVDTHAHWFEIRRQVQEAGQWDFLANLAYGVTSGLEVQAFTADIFAYQDMIDAGMMPGPRAYTTGMGVFRNSPETSEDDVLAVLGRYRDHYRTRNIKAYMVGDRAERQRMVAATQAMGMMATTEGASDLDLDLTHFIDGFAGNEHALPVSPLHEDVIQLMAKSRTSYTPTLGVLYGGAPALFEKIMRDRPQDDPKFRRFVPPNVVAEKLRNRHWMPEEAQTSASFAADAIKVQRAGGLIGIGSHGEMQGLGYHWEMAVLASGGATPMEVLHAATIGSAEVIGRSDEIGSLEPGKFADLLVLDADPRAAIANTQRIGLVMKNGRLYDAATLDELWPRAKPLDAPWFAGEGE